MIGSRRGRPSLIGRAAQTAARTAVIAGTATAVSGKVAPGGADGGGEAGGPDVLEEERGGGGAGGEIAGERLQVGLGEEPADLAGQREKGARDLGGELLRLEDGDGALPVLAHHGDVDHPDQPAVEEIVQRREDVAAEAVALEADHDVLDRAELAVGHGSPPFAVPPG